MFKYRNMMTFRSKNLLVGILLMAAYTNIVDAQPNCGQTSFSGDQGVIRSPGYPNNYTSGLYCDYTITVPLGSFIHLMFNTFDLQHNTWDDNAETLLRCNSDYVLISQGAGPSSSEVMYPELLVSGYTPADEGKLCGNQLPPDYRSTVNVMTVRFSSDDSVQSSGFELEWEAIRDICGQHYYYTTEYDHFRVPGHPDTYDANLNCTYKIHVPRAGATIHLYFDFVDLQEPAQSWPFVDPRTNVTKNVDLCLADFVKVFDGDSTNSPQLGFTLCGSGRTPHFRSSTTVITMWFVTDSSIQKQGFNVRWVIIQPPIDFDGCGIRPPRYDNMRGISKRIVGGDDAGPAVWPFICYVYNNVTALYVCAGTLVRNSYGQFHLITAAHCFDTTVNVDAQTYTADCAMYVKGLPTATVDVKRVVIHHSYINNDFYLNNDIAILELDSHQAQSYGLQAVCIANEEPFVDEDAVVLGWGMTEQANSSTFLQELTVKIKEHGECAIYPGFYEDYEICAGTGVDGFGACPGDSGGPLLTFRSGKWFLIGVVSGGGTYSQPCGSHDNFHTVYMDVFKYRNWIQRQF